MKKKLAIISAKTHLVILQRNLLELTVNHGLSLEGWSRLLDLGSQERLGGREVARLQDGKLLLESKVEKIKIIKITLI